MKKIITLFSSLLLIFPVFASGISDIKLISSDNGTTLIRFTPSTPIFKTVSTPGGFASTIQIDKGTFLLEAGAPDLQKLTTSLIIPDMAKMQVTVISETHYDLTGVDIAPSKGNLKRNIDPSTVPYTYGAAYSQDAFFPANMATLNKPYILRDYRAQAVNVCPFQYNPVTKTLRVYTDLVISVSVADASNGENAFERMAPPRTIDREFDAIYQRQFINHSGSANVLRYAPVEEDGSMLIICYDAFAPDMSPFVQWKNKKGIATELVLKSAVGTTAAAIKTYIANYYASHPSLKYVLLVGDAAEIPASSTSYGDSDNNYGYISGSDSYPEILMGRFSCSSNTHVQIMVNRTLAYEQTPQAGAAWYKKGIAIASDQGPGDDGEMDFEHQRNLISLLTSFTYNNYSENFDGSQGGLDASGNPTASSIGAQINNNVGIITYTGHGSDFAFSTSGYSTSSITSLTNTTAHPFIWSVACVNGNFVSNPTCFAEGWLRAGTPSAPTGALATLMSTINQSWNPPMEGQDAMVAILTENDGGNIKRTFGGLSMNGCMQMNDAYGSAGDEMTDTWTVFGDPSVMVYTDTPAPMTTTHAASVPVSTTSVTVNNDVYGALVCISRAGVIQGTGYSNGASVNITIPAAVAGTLDVTATAFNKMPYTGVINVAGSVGVDESNASSFITYPNPANNSLTVAYNAPDSDQIRLSLYNALGQSVQTITESISAGTYKTTFELGTLPAGVYTCKLETGSTVLTKQVIIQK